MLGIKISYGTLVDIIGFMNRLLNGGTKLLIYSDGNVERKEGFFKPGGHERALMTLISPKAEEVKHVVGNVLNCHPLVLEDCLHLNQRPKVDMYKDHAFIPFFSFDEKWELVELGLIISQNYLLVIASKPISAIEELRRMFLESAERMETTGRMIYELLDLLSSQYFDFVDRVEEKLTNMEKLIYRNPYAKVGHEIFQMKRKLHAIRRVFSEERNVLSTLMHVEFPYTSENGNVYFMDIQDHLNRAVDAVDSFREGLTGLLELQMSMKGDKMNTIMKTLTVVSTFFLPLTFIVGLYGVNLKGVPEYQWNFGYAYMWGLMIVVSVVMWWFMKGKNGYRYFSFLEDKADSGVTS